MGFHFVANHHHVADRNTLGNTNGQIEIGLDRLPDRISSARWRNIDHGYGCAGGGLGILD